VVHLNKIYHILDLHEFIYLKVLLIDSHIFFKNDIKKRLI